MPKIHGETSGDEGETAEIYANASMARTRVVCAFLGVFFAIFIGNHDATGARLFPLILTVAIGAGLVGISKLRPGPSVVLSPTEICFRRPVGRRCVAYARISSIGEVRVPLGRARNGLSLNPGGGPLNHFVTIKVVDGRPLHVQADDVSMPLAEFRKMLIDRCR